MVSKESNHLLKIKTFLQMTVHLFLQAIAGSEVYSCTCVSVPHVCPGSRSPELVLESCWTGDGTLCHHGNAVHHWRLFLRLTSPVDTEPLTWHAVHDVHHQYVILTHLQDKDGWSSRTYLCVYVCVSVCSPLLQLKIQFYQLQLPDSMCNPL